MSGQPPPPSEYPLRHDDEFVRRPLPPYNRGAGPAADYSANPLAAGGGYRVAGGGGLPLGGRGDFHNNSRRYDDRGEPAPLPALSSPTSSSFPRSRAPYPPATAAPYGNYPPPAYHNSAYPPPASAPPYGSEWNDKDRERRDVRRFDDGREVRDMYEYDRDRPGRERDKEREAGELSAYQPYPPPPTHSPLTQPVGAPNGRGSSRPWSSPWSQPPPYSQSASSPPLSFQPAGPPPPLSSPTTSGYTIREMSEPLGRDRHWDRRGPPPPSNYSQPPPPPPSHQPPPLLSSMSLPPSFQPPREYREPQFAGRPHPYRRSSGGAVAAGYPPAVGYPGRGGIASVRYGRSSRSSSRSRSPSPSRGPSRGGSPTASRSRSRSPHTPSRSRSRSPDRLRSDSREPPLPRRETSVPLPPSAAYTPMQRSGPRSSSPPPGPLRPFVQTGGQPHPPPPPRQPLYGQPLPASSYSSSSFAGQPRMPSPSSHGSFQQGFGQQPPASSHHPPPSPTYRQPVGRSSSPPPLASPTLSPNRSYLSRHSSMQTTRGEEEGEINEEDERITPRHYPSTAPPFRSQPSLPAPPPPQPISQPQQPVAFTSSAPQQSAPSATLPPALSLRSVSQSSSASVASGVGEEQKAAGELPQRQDSNVPLPVTSVPSMFTAATSNAASPLIQAPQPAERLMHDDKREEKKEAAGSEQTERSARPPSITSTDSRVDARPSLFRASTLHSSFLSSSSSSSSSPFSATLPPSLSSSLLSSSTSSAAAVAAAAASKKRKVGFGLGLATLEKQKVPTAEELKEGAAQAEQVTVKKEAEAETSSKPSSLFRAISAPETEQRQLSPSTPLATLAESPSSSHRSLSVTIPPPNISGQPPTASASSMTSPVAHQPSSPAVDRKLNEAFASTMTSPFTSPFPSAPPRPTTVGTPPSLSSSLSPSPPSSPPLSPTPLSDLDEAAASSSLEDDRDKAESAAARQVPPHLLLMSKHSLLAAIQKLDEQINAGEEERDTLMERARDWKKRTEDIRVKGERMGLGDDGQKEEYEEDESYEELMAEERRQRETEQRQRDREEQERRKEEQYEFEHFTVSDPTDALMPPSTRIYAANQQRASHAHHHFDRLYSDFFTANASRPPPLERPSSLNVLSTLSDRSTRAALHLPLYSQPNECALYQDNLRMFPLYRQRVSAVVARTRRRTYGKLRRLAAQYVQAEKRWLHEEEQRNARLRNQPPMPRLSRNNAHLLQADVSGYSYNDYNYRDTQLTSRQYEQKKARWSRGLVSIPPMIIDDSDRRHSRFLSRNGYIEDAKEEERQYKLSNPWTDREKAVFESKYIKFPKQFRKIATYLPNKNVNDCVAYYYYSKLSVNYAELVRREQKRQRIEKRGRRRGEGGEEEEEEDEEQQQQQQQELDAAVAAGGPGGSGSGRMAAASVGGGKKRVAAKPRVGAAKPRGMSRELIGLAIDLSNQGKGDRAAGSGGRHEEREGGEEDGQTDDMDTDTAAGAEDGNDGDADEAMEEEGGEDGAAGKDDKLTDSTTLPTHLDLYDDEDEKEAQMAADTKSDTDTRQPATHTSDDDEEELIHPALTTEATSPKPIKKRRLSRSQQPASSPAGPQPSAPQQSVLWSESERSLFLSGLDVYGKNFAEIAAHVGSKSADKCKNFWNNNKSKLGLEDRLQRWKQQTAQHKEPTVKQMQATTALLPASDTTGEADTTPVPPPDADDGKAPAVDRRSSVSSAISSEGQSSPEDSDGDEEEKGDQRVPVRRSSLSQGKSDSKERPTVLHWTQAEKDALLAALTEHGRDWAALSAAVPSRTLKQIKTWWQNNLLRLGLKDMVEEVKRRKARESVAAAVSAASQAHSSGTAPPAALSLPTSNSASLVVSPSMRSTAASSPNNALVPALSGFPVISSLSSSMPGLSSPVLVIPSSLSSPAVSLQLPATAAGPPNAESGGQSESSAAPFPFVSLPGQSSLIAQSALSPAAASTSVVLSPSTPLMLMIPPTALSPAMSPARLSATSTPFVLPHLPQLSPGPLLLAASAASSPSTLVSASTSPSTAALLSVTAGAVDSATANVEEAITAVQPAGSRGVGQAEMDDQLTEDDTRAVDVDNASVMAAPPTVIEDTHMSRSLPPSLVHTPVNASTLVSPSSVFHSTSSGMDVDDGGYLVTASRSSTGVLSSPSLPLSLSSIPHVPFTSIAQDLTDQLAASTSSTPVVSALPSPAHPLPLSFMPSLVPRPLPETMSLASPNLSAIDRTLMSPSPSPSVSSMKGAPPSPPTAATDEEMEMERPLSPPASPTSTRRAMSTFSPLSHLAHHPLSSSPPSPASDKTSPVSSSPPSPTPSILSLHTLASPTIEGRGHPPEPSSAVSSPQQRSLPPPNPTRSILRGYQLKETAAAVQAAAGEREREKEEEKQQSKRRATADSAGSSSSASPKQAAMDEEAKEESELETDEMRDDASMCTALSALPEPPSSPRQSPTNTTTPRSPLSSSRVVSPNLGMEEDERTSRAEDDEERPVVHRDDSGSQQSVRSVPASATGTSSLLSPPLPSLSASSSGSAPLEHGSLAPLNLSRGSSIDAERAVSSSTVSMSGDEAATVSTLYSPASSPSSSSRQESLTTSEDAADDMQSQP